MSEVDYTKLKTQMLIKGTNQQKLAKACAMTESTFSLKINNKGVFKQTEMQKIIEILEIPEKEIGNYFFKL